MQLSYLLVGQICFPHAGLSFNFRLDDIRCSVLLCMLVQDWVVLLHAEHFPRETMIQLKPLVLGIM